MQRPETLSKLSMGPHEDQRQGMARDVQETPASPPSPTETDSDSSSTVRDVTPGPSHTIGTSAPADAAAINEDSQIINGKTLDAGEEKLKVAKPFSSFTQQQKWGIVVMSSIAGLFSPISSVILAPSLPILVEQFQRSSEDINLTMTLYLVLQGLTPSFWGSLSDSIGRRPVYIMTLSIYVGACIGLALTPTSAYWLLLVLRMVQATGGSAVIAIGSGCVSDIATPGERGKYMGLFSALSMAGPAIGPVLGGILSYALSWRWIFWILAIGCGISLVAIIFFLPETLRSIVGDGSLPKPWYNRRPQESLKLREEAKHRFGKGILPPVEVEKLQRKKFKPFESFRMLFYPDVILMLLYSSLIYAEYYCVLTVYSQLLKKNYRYNDIQIGLCYLSNGAGAMAMAFGIGRFLDWDFKRAKTALGFNPTEAISLDGFPIEKTRLRAFPYVVTIYLVSCIGLGWALQSRTHIAVSVILNFFIGGGLQITMGITSVLLVDLFPGTGGAITASFNLTRCLIGAGATAVIDPVISAIGEGWAFTLFSGIIIVLAPMPIVLVKKGPAWRKARADAMKVKADIKEAHRKEKANAN